MSPSWPTGGKRRNKRGDKSGLKHEVAGQAYELKEAPEPEWKVVRASPENLLFPRSTCCKTGHCQNLEAKTVFWNVLMCFGSENRKLAASPTDTSRIKH
jgi:hypothetical protein